MSLFWVFPFGYAFWSVYLMEDLCISWHVNKGGRNKHIVYKQTILKMKKKWCKQTVTNGYETSYEVKNVHSVWYQARLIGSLVPPNNIVGQISDIEKGKQRTTRHPIIKERSYIINYVCMSSPERQSERRFIKNILQLREWLASMRLVFLRWLVN